jgi:hypothetical protein
VTIATTAQAAARERVVAFIFVSERGSPFTTADFARMIELAAAGAGLIRLAANSELSSHAMK